MSRYRKFYYVDSFSAIGEKNSSDFVSNGSPVSNFISDVITQWNTHIIAKCQADLDKGEMDEEGVKRSNKIIANIRDKVNTQFVLADVCISLLSCPEPDVHSAVLTSIEPYPKWEAGPSNTYVFNDERREARREALIATLRD